MKFTNFLRFLLVAVAAVMVFSLFACVDEPETETTTEEIENTTESSDDKKPEDSEKDTDDSESTPVGGDTESVPDEESSSEEESTSETEPDCQHVEETVAGKAATCTEAGLTEGKKCSKCGETLVAQEEIPALGHTVATYTTYVANPDGNEALIAGECSVCHEMGSKPASFFLTVETIYGNVNNDTVVVFPAKDGDILMAPGKLAFVPGHPNYPADGFAPIALDCPVYDGAFNGMIGVGGWVGYLGADVADGAQFKVVDADGTVLVEWTNLTQLTPNTADDNVNAFLATAFTDMTAVGYRYANIVDLKPYWGILGGKTVTVELAFTTTQGVDGDVYIPYAELQVVVPACEHVEVDDAAKDPTCTEAGLTAGKHCSICGTVTVAQEEIPALGHTAGEKDIEKNCNSYCTVCGEVAVEGQHASDKIASVWTPVAEKNEDGMLQEAKLCADCGQPAEIRTVGYQNNLDGIKVNGVTVDEGNPGNDKQTNGLGGKKSDYWVYDAQGKLVDRNDNELVVTDTLGIFGWFACNGGVERYVFRINDGEWTTVSGSTGNVAEGDGHDKAIVGTGLELSDYRANVKFALLNAYGLQKYAGETISVTFGAIPANNPGTAEEPNVIYMIVINNVKITCDHSGSENVPVVDENNPQIVTTKCSICGYEGEGAPTVTDEGLLLFGPELIATMAGDKGTVVTDDNGMKYVSIKAQNPAASEENFHIFSSAVPATNIGGYIAILYRSSVTQNVEIVCDSVKPAVWTGPQSFGTTEKSETWNLKVMKLASHNGFDGTQLTALRFDQFNGANNRTADDTTDVVFIAFFSSEKAAVEFYGKYIDAFIGKENCSHFSDNNWVKVEGTDGHIATHCVACGAALGEKACDHPAEKVGTLTPSDDQFGVYEAECTLCGFVATFSDINGEGLKVIKGEEIITRIDAYKSGTNAMDKTSGTYYFTVESKTDAEHNDLAYTRVTATQNIGKDCYIYFNRASVEKIMNGGKYISVLYRTNNTNEGRQSFIANGGVDGKINNYCADWVSTGEWTLLIWDYSTYEGFDPAKGVGDFRWDIFDGGCDKDAYTDIAYIAFHNSADSANAYYADFCANYGLTEAAE